MTTPEVKTPTGFAEIGVPERIDAGLAAAGFSAPFAIQTEAIPVALAGEDVMGRARTGSGKTLAFGVPMMSRIDAPATPGKPHGLVIVPTRELALQVSEVLGPIGKHCGIRVLAVYGGADRQKQVVEIEKGVEIIVATPLRLIDLMKSSECD
jgi:superfamily II DNA/RNA helicase